MKRLLVFLAFCFSTAIAQVAVSPGCPPLGDVAVGPGCVVPVPVDPRKVAIRAYWDRYAIYPAMVFDAMQQFGVDADELEDSIDYRVDIYQWLRYNQAPDGLGGVKQWPDASIDQYLSYFGRDIKDKWLRVFAQDALDTAARRKALYEGRGMPVPDSIAPWEH